jgi:hypothetical protein
MNNYLNLELTKIKPMSISRQPSSSMDGQKKELIYIQTWSCLESQKQPEHQQQWVYHQERLIAHPSWTSSNLLEAAAMHQQTEKMEARARKLIWRLFITKYNKNITKTCLPCQ